ncbi:hypothetical protein EOM89_02670 [Candidatus Falkowbacteria bacterium]|nr:hypothetical protein [Candidatus Falkowbacteria bacterium]
MIGVESVLPLIQAHGVALLAPMAVLEGPIVTVIAAWLARLAYIDIVTVCVVVIVADLIGDTLFYLLGRRGVALLPAHWRARLKVDEQRLAQLTDHFRTHGGRMLLLGKLTHSVGFLVLIAAGAARMNPAAFLGYNLLAGVPKSLFFVAIGYTLGHASEQIDSWIFRASFMIVGVGVLVGVTWYLLRRRNTT